MAYCCGVISRRVFTVNTGEALHDVACCYFVDSINVQTGSRLDTDEHQQALTFKLQGFFFFKRGTLQVISLCCKHMLSQVGMFIQWL